MERGLLGTDVVTQIGIIVRDIERSCRECAALFGLPVPSWFWTDGVEKAKTEYRGKPSKARAKLAFLKLGNLEVELIEPDGEPSTWREFLDKNGEGIHHVAFVVQGMKGCLQELEKGGHPLLQKGEYTGGRYAYIDTVRTLKTVVELLENDPGEAHQE
jgi:methylmalonyl-CoA/ethylmalonyl-CoA epimerase